MHSAELGSDFIARCELKTRCSWTIRICEYTVHGATIYAETVAPSTSPISKLAPCKSRNGQPPQRTSARLSANIRNRHEAARMSSIEHSVDVNVSANFNGWSTRGQTSRTYCLEIQGQKRCSSARQHKNREFRFVSHVHHINVVGSMTAPIATTSLGSSSHSPQSHESNSRSPLKRTHSEQHSAEDYRSEDGQRGRPIKKIKQGEEDGGQEPDGFVTRLFKYAWQLIGPTTEG